MKKHPFSWLFSLYFAEGVPAAVICEVAVVLFAKLGDSPENIARNVSILGMPWVAKPLWAVIVDKWATKKKWIVFMQLLLGAIFFGAAAYTLPATGRIIFYLFLAGSFLSATHDIAADGFYLVALDAHRQALYSGWRSVCYRAAMIAANGGVLLFVAHTQTVFNLTPWQQALALCGVLFIALALWHMIALPQETRSATEEKMNFLDSMLAFCRIPHLTAFLLFLLFYRFAEAQLGIVSKLFLLDGSGGALSLETYSVSVGIYGVGAMLAGGVLGGWAASRCGLKKILFPMALFLNVPDALYLLWAFHPISGKVMQTLVIATEQFGYGFGFTGYMLLMLYLAGSCGKFKTTVFSYLTCLMILGLRLPGMFSGDLLIALPRWLNLGAAHNYRCFFLWVTAATLVSFAVTILAARYLPENFGKAGSKETSPQTR